MLSVQLKTVREFNIPLFSNSRVSVTELLAVLSLLDVQGPSSANTLAF